MAKNKKFRKWMKSLTQQLDSIAGNSVETSDYLRGHNDAVAAINRRIKRELEATK